MKNLFVFLFFTLLGAAAIGCKNQVADKNTQLLDSLIEVIEADKAVANSVDMQKLGKMLSVYDNFFEFYRTEYAQIDSLKYFLHVVEEMATCRKNAQKTHAQLEGWRTELERTEGQLKSLKHDYENELISSADFETFLNSEMYASFRINSEFQKRAGATVYCMRTFKELTDKLDSTRVYYLKNQNE